ncbi:ankyrin repeat domain-containing protein [Microbacterium sp. T2.11-28]|uniref:ankyrin repeat domain-containing protein n=1 Tax=Microbacterium sp. T2.11-28 TaxID=3041169 RepID=UPI00253FFA27|nr:ankyrin repeat domain-containing protein [Microbacterium sp. T2.11-28]
MPSQPSSPRTLGFAVWGNDIALVRELLDAGAAVDSYGSDTADDVTPLMESVDEMEPFYDASRAGLTQLLLSAGADVMRCDSAGRTALHYAAGAGCTAIELLLAAGADADAADGEGVTPLHEAIDRGNISAIEALCRGGANRSAQDRSGRTPADVLLENQDGFTSAELAVIRALVARS